MRLVIIESPYAGDVAGNVEYARACMKDSIMRGESPIASHLLYTQPGILDDLDPEERALGIKLGLSWRVCAEVAVFYVDRGWSKGMVAAKELYEREEIPYVERSINADTVCGSW